MVVTEGVGFTAICTEADLVASAVEVAVTVVGVAPVGAAAVYVADVEVCALNEPAPVTLHCTPALIPVTEAVRLRV